MTPKLTRKQRKQREAERQRTRPTGEDVHRKPETETTKPENDKRESGPLQAAPLTVKRLGDTNAEASNTESGNKNSRDNHQQAGINWLAVQTIATIIFGLATIGVLIYHGVIFSKQQVATDGQLSAARDQLDMARKQFEAMDRPWVSIKAAAYGPLEFGKDYASLPVEFVAANRGQSAATFVTINTELFVGKYETGAVSEAVERRDKLCRNVNSNQMAQTLFPGDPYIQRLSFSMPNDALQRGRMLPTDLVFNIFLVGCVDYTFGGQTTHHQTGFVYEVSTFGPEAPHINRAIRIGENLPSERIRLSKPVLSIDFAN
jgi:hypothetical protein